MWVDEVSVCTRETRRAEFSYARDRRREHFLCHSHRPPPSALIMAEGENDWIIEDSEEEDQLSSSQHVGHRPTSPLPPGERFPG